MNLICDIYALSDFERFVTSKIAGIVVPLKYFTPRSHHYFNLIDLKEIKQRCLENNILMYVDLTRMFTDDEMAELERILVILKELKVDGIYFADLSVYEICRDLGMEDILRYQSDTLIVNSYDAEFYLKQNIACICLAKELMLTEICEISKYNNGNVEVFIHGHALMSFSKRPLISNYFEEIGHEQTLKPYYHLKEELRDDLIPVMENEQGVHFFSAKALMSFNEISQLVEAKVKYAKISRMFLSDDEYFEVINLYSKTLAHEEINIDALISKYPSSHYDSGFYYKKTSVKKEY